MRWALVLLFGLGCGERPQEPELNNVSENEPALTGIWTTHGVDQILGAIEVSMELKPDGSLSMVMVLASGGRRSFPGTWILDSEVLVLRGAYFTPGGESRVRWIIEGSVLVLENSVGQREEWQRKD